VLLSSPVNSACALGNAYAQGRNGDDRRDRIHRIPFDPIPLMLGCIDLSKSCQYNVLVLVSLLFTLMICSFAFFKMAHSDESWMNPVTSLTNRGISLAKPKPLYAKDMTTIFIV
jgi:hypothetical protein